MSLRVPFLTEETIERDAEVLLAQFAHARGIELAPPIPIDDIVEKHLKLRVGFGDLHEMLGVPRSSPELEPDIFGAIWLDCGEIVIDESLDPDENPWIEGRYRFTLAHEAGGHWRLHRDLVGTGRDQGSLFGHSTRPTVVCRSSQAKAPAEWQADFYASCLLMPRKLVFESWRRRFGDGHPRILRRDNRIPIPCNTDNEFAVAIRALNQNRDDELLQKFVRQFAEQFLVSPVAMRIRLEKLGLLRRDVPRQRTLAIDA